MKNILILFFLSLLCASAYSKDEESFVQGAYKYYISSDTTAKLSDVGIDILLPVSEDSTLVLPSSVEYEGKNYAVTDIVYGAFSGHHEIKHLVISEGIEFIEEKAFFRCLNLESVHFPSTFGFVGSYGMDVFKGCKNLSRITVDERNEVYDSREDCNALIVTEDNLLFLGCYGTRIPSSVVTICAGAFAFCERLERIDIPEGVKCIEDVAFSDCPNLKEISLPNSLNTLGVSIFYNCMSLESITIPRNVSHIDSRLFSGCYNMKNVVVDKRNRTFDSRNNCNAIIDTSQDTIVAGCGNSVILDGIKGIGSMSFYRTSIRSIRIPASVHHIGRGAFLISGFCNSISVDPKNPVYDSRDNCNAIIETSAGRLVQGCMTTSIPEGVREIGEDAFRAMRLPSYLVIPEGVEVIGEGAFAHCNDIKNVQLPSSLKRLDFLSFGGCDNLCYVDMSRSRAKIEAYAFSGCPYLYTVNLSPGNNEIDSNAFERCPCAEWVKKFIEANK